MGSTPFCFCSENKNCINAISDVIIKQNDNDLNLNYKERTEKENYNINKISDYDNNRSNSTFSPPGKFINPLPDIVVLKYKKL